MPGFFYCNLILILGMYPYFLKIRRWYPGFLYAFFRNITLKEGIPLLNGCEYIRQAYDNCEGFISRMYIDNKKYGTYTYHYTKDSLAKMPADGEENLYISQNTFFRPVRNKDSLKRLNMLYIDLDCYKLGLRKDSVLYILNEEYIGWKIPRPTFIVDSGRGLYLLWKINEDRNAFPRWKRVQHYLHNVLKDLGSDSSVTEDVARVLRVPGSINSKTGTQVKILSYYDYTYTLYEIIKNYLPDDFYSLSKNIQKPFKRCGNIIRMATLNTLVYARMKDIENLLLYRDKTGNLHLRENCLFMYRFYCCNYYNDTAKALQLTLELFNRLSDKSEYTEKSIALRTKSAEKYYLNRNRKFSNKKIIELLGISEEEQKILTTLITKDYALSRKRERDRKSYLKKLEAQGKCTKKKAIEQRRSKIKELLSQNKSYEEVCNILSISRATFYRDLEAINKDSLDRPCPKKISKVKDNVIHLSINNKYVVSSSQNFRLCITRDVVPTCPFSQNWDENILYSLFSFHPRGDP